MDKKRKVLMINTSFNDLGKITALRDMNQYIIAVGNETGLVGQKYVDKYVCLDYSDKESVLKLAKEEGIEGVCAGSNDMGVEVAAYVAEQLDLKGHDSLATVLTLHNKNKFHELANKLHLLVPVSRSFTDSEEAKKYIHTVVLPVIVKPVDLWSGRGVMKVEKIEDADLAVDCAFSISRTKAIVIEQYIEGSQHAICTFLYNQKVVAMTSNNEYEIVNPFHVEIDTFPASNIEEIKGFLIDEIEKISNYLHLCNGIFHMQYRIMDGKPYIIEPMRRTLGNMYGIPAYQVSGFNWDYWEARTHVGLDISEIPSMMGNEGYAAYRALMADRNGVIDHIEVSDIVKEYIVGEYIHLKKGERVNHYQSDTVGLYFFKFKSEEDMMRIMVDRYADIKVVMEL